MHLLHSGIALLFVVHLQKDPHVRVIETHNEHEATMAYVTQNQTAGATFAKAAGLVERMRTAWTQYRVYRTTLNELQELSARELDDLGLHRSMLRQVAHETAYGKAH
ncbi:DUF1127 domain-containing protein [Pseudaestuariivita sp.]|uniref:DUF1127 domain-containing protein n=1 Tax=Pseudaestuariivita sp. TaxID=2211669 RepID=UPI0040592855